MLLIVLTLWTWHWRQCFCLGDPCSTFLAFDDLSLTADIENSPEFEEGADLPRTRNFGEIDSMEFAAQLWPTSGEGGEVLLEIFSGGEKVKSCQISESMPRSRQCCETQFLSHGKEVKFELTCLKADRFKREEIRSQDGKGKLV